VDNDPTAAFEVGKVGIAVLAYQQGLRTITGQSGSGGFMQILGESIILLAIAEGHTDKTHTIVLRHFSCSPHRPLGTITFQTFNS